MKDLVSEAVEGKTRELLKKAGKKSADGEDEKISEGAIRGDRRQVSDSKNRKESRPPKDLAGKENAQDGI